MPIYPARARLPATYSAHIGRIVTRWAHLEANLRQVGYSLLQINPKLGRLVMREPRIADHLTMIEDAIGVIGFTIKTDFKKLKIALRSMEACRDKLAHGVWINHPDNATPILQDTKGASTEGGKSTKARINPKGVIVTVTEMQEWARSIAYATNLIRDLGLEIEAQWRSSPCRCCGQPLPEAPSRPLSQKLKALPAQPLPS
jgi:hypothetical protein